MTIQMREGWAVRRDGEVCRYVHNTAHAWGETNPWVPDAKGPRFSVRDDGGSPTWDDSRPFDGDVVELLDPWDARVPEEHREKRFVVAELKYWNGIVYEVAYDRKYRAYSWCSAAHKTAESVCVKLNAGTDALTRQWLKGNESFASIDVKPYNHDGSPIAEVKATPEPLKDDPFKVVDPSSRTSRTLQAGSWIVWAEKTGNGDPVVVVESKSSSPSSIKEARAFAEAILEVCREIEES